ncbi:MAG: tRNA 2-thiouridine(34) synthase MnmA, partial [candidate division Zixibacteria bacterium]|nr:tRNA 2-thiouridine(34) synthase MnmA [candidate division Zixibacteria bacterium]
ELGCDYIATGHYVRVERLNNDRWAIRKGLDNTRDQSYVLWRLTQSDLARTITPLGDKLKSDIRQYARKHNLPTAEKMESREICFIPDDDYNRFLREYGHKEGTAFEPGEVVHEDGRVLGKHKGVAFYTVGQRKGMGISHPTPLYVKKIDVANNRIIVGDNDTLFENKVAVEDVNWVGMAPANAPFEAQVKIRYKHEAAPALISPLTEKKVQIIFEDKQRAITPGQSAVFYDNDILLGGGVIK